VINHFVIIVNFCYTLGMTIERYRNSGFKITENSFSSKSNALKRDHTIAQSTDPRTLCHS